MTTTYRTELETARDAAETYIAWYCGKQKTTREENRKYKEMWAELTRLNQELNG